MKRNWQGGFTLVELMIVVIIVGILAAVAIPMYQRSTERAKAAEAVAALGTIRVSLRNYYAEHRTYANAAFVDGADITVNNILDVSNTDLDGRYFSTDCYTFNGVPTANAYSIECNGSISTAPYASEVSTITRYIDQNGSVTE